MKSTNVAAYGVRPPTRCVWCLRPSWSDHDTCRECRGIEANLRRGYTDADALTGGRWVNRGAVKVWRPTPVTPAPIIGSHGTLEESAGEIVAEVYRRAMVGRRESAA